MFLFIYKRGLFGASCEPESKLLRGDYIRNYIGDYYRGMKGDTRSLDYSSCP